MSADVVIRANHLGKKYVIGHQSADRTSTLRDTIVRAAGNLARTSSEILRGRPIISGDETEEFWALRDVSFEIQRGDVVGIIGRNGAGKSTLLKVLSRITEPSEGRVELKGRVASLLEVGTGFHPELTGRENVFLNGAILGMSQSEIRSKFDEIVAFAEIEKFLDTPVKRYSSGMYVRLAFAVAAHLDPEILIVDEVLAVGDAEFQKKCLGKMQDVAGGGRTVLFVSHNLAAVRQLCTQGLLLTKGMLVTTGTANAVADHYLRDMLAPQERPAVPSGASYFDIRLVNQEGASIAAATGHQDVYLEFGLVINSAIEAQAGFTIYNQLDVPLVLSASEYGRAQLRRGENRFRVKLPAQLLHPGLYRIEGAIWEKDRVLYQNDCLYTFQITPTHTHELQGRGSRANFISREHWSDLSTSVSATAGALQDNELPTQSLSVHLMNQQDKGSRA
jgi:lipopolysaccharide transport system ATP-binding protein